MIKSMTGFGRGEYTDGKRNMVVEIKTVNHRYADITIKMPRRYSFAEDKIKSAIKAHIRRGKADVFIMVENIGDSDVSVQINEELAKQYLEKMVSLRDALEEPEGFNDQLSLLQIAGLPDVIKVTPAAEDEEEIMQALLIPTMQAAENLDKMRAAEGEKLAEDLLAKGENLKTLLDRIAARAPQVATDYTAKLRERITELIGNSVQIPEDRILVEAAIFADKCAIDEEITRLNSHIMQLRDIVTTSNQPDGKKLDFLVQEMNREANTIGSKANDIMITGYVLDLKSEIEKIREQVQNIE